MYIYLCTEEKSQIFENYKNMFGFELMRKSFNCNNWTSSWSNKALGACIFLDEMYLLIGKYDESPLMMWMNHIIHNTTITYASDPFAKEILKKIFSDIFGVFHILMSHWTFTTNGFFFAIFHTMNLLVGFNPHLEFPCVRDKRIRDV